MVQIFHYESHIDEPIQNMTQWWFYYGILMFQHNPEVVLLLIKGCFSNEKAHSESADDSWIRKTW